MDTNTPKVNPTNRRKDARYPRTLPIEIEGHTKGETVDVSHGGFAAEAPATFVPGQSISGTIIVLGQRFGFEAQVRWVVPNAPASFGARFTGVDPRLKAYTKGVAGQLPTA